MHNAAKKPACAYIRFKPFLPVFLLLAALAGQSNAVDISACTTFSAGTFYNLTADITGAASTCMVAASNTILDCGGHSVAGTNGSTENGFDIQSRIVNVTVFNCTFLNFTNGIALNNLNSQVNVSFVNSSWNNMYGVYIFNSPNNSVNNSVFSGDKRGVEISNAANDTVNNCTMNVSGNYGIVIEGVGSYNDTLSNNKITQSVLHGIVVVGLSGNSTISGNNLSKNNVGVQLQSGVIGMLVANNTANGNAYGFNVQSGSWNDTFSNNTANSNTVNGWQFVGYNFTVANNTANGNSQNGFYVSGTSNSSFSNNSANSNLNYGLYFLGNSANNSVSNNSAIGNTQHGVRLEGVGSTNNTFNLLVSYNNGWNGFYDLSAGNNTLSNSNVSANSMEGAMVNNASNFVVASITANGNGRNGFYLNASNNSQISNSVANGSTYSGFNFSASNNGVATNNTATRNSLSGFWVSSSNYLTVTGSNVSFNTNAGINFTASNSSNVTNSTAVGNLADGLFLFNSVNDNFSGNNFSGSTVYDLDAQAASGSGGMNTITNCTFSWAKANLLSGTNSTFQYYLRVNATDSTGAALNGASVNVTNATSGTPMWQVSTDATGLTGWNLATYLTGNGAVNTTYSPHNVSALLSGYALTSSNFTVNSTQTVLMQLTDNVAPASFAYVTPTDANNSLVYRNYYSVNATFTETNPSACLLEVNGASNVSMARTGNYCFLNQTGQGNGNYSYRVFANDTAGNWGVSANQTVSLLAWGCGMIVSAGGSYLMDADISGCTGSGIIISANNTILDCNGHVIDGTDATNSYGVYANVAQNITVTNCTITNFTNGVMFNYTSSSTVSWVNSSLHASHGFFLRNSNNSTLANNTALRNYYYGFWLNFSNNNTLVNNSAISNRGDISGVGLRFENSSNNTVLNNTAFANEIVGFQMLSGSNNNLLQNNTAYASSAFLSGYGFSITACLNITVAGNNVSKNLRYGISLSGVNNSLIANNTVSSNSYPGITLSAAKNNTVSNNNASQNSQYGIYLTSANDSVVSNNTVNNNTQYGIYLLASSMNNTIANNTAINNTQFGIFLSTSSNNTLTNNTANNNLQYGLALSSSANNTLANNTATGNAISGLVLSGANSSNFTGNSFGGTSADVNASAASINNSFVNNSFAWSKVSLASGTNSTFRYYLRVNATDSTGAAMNAVSVNITNATSGTPMWQVSTDATGLTGWNLVTYLIGNGAVNTTYSPHNVSAWKTGFHTNSTNYAINSTQTVAEALYGDVAPGVSMNAPSDALVSASSAVNFNGTASDDWALQNVSVFTNITGAWAVNQTNSSPYNNTLANFQLTGIPDGAYLWNLQACDSAGNCVFAAANRTFAVDTAAPASFAFVSPTDADGSWQARNYYPVNATFAEANPSACLISINGGANVSMALAPGSPNYCFINRTLQSDGNYSYVVYANDSAGNWGVSANRTVALDTVAPQIAIQSPANASYALSPIPLNYTFVEPNVAQCWYSYNGTNTTLANCANSTFAAVSGTSALVLWANDTSGNENSTAAVFSYSSSAPSVSLSAPSGNSWSASRAVQFNYSPTDELGFANCSLYTNESAWSPAASNSSAITNNSQNSISHTFAADGAYLWNIQCYGSAGRQAFAAANYSANIDSTMASNFTFVPPTDADGASVSRNYYYVNATFTETNPDSCVLEANGANYSMPRSGANCALNRTSQSGGNQTYRVYANDSAGNWNASGNRTIIISVAPVATPSPTSQGYNPSHGPYASPTPTPLPAATPSPRPSATPSPRPAEVPANITEVTPQPGQPSPGAGKPPQQRPSTFELSYTAGSGGFNGTLSYRLPLNYADYLAGKITFEPKPARVHEGGGIIAEWDANLADGETFKSKIIVVKGLETALRESMSTLTALAATPNPLNLPPMAPEEGREAAQPQLPAPLSHLVLNVVGALLLLLVLVGVYLHYIRKYK